MKTTIDFPEELFQRAKIAAVQRKSTLKQLVFQGLEHILRDSAPAPRGLSDQFLAGLQARNSEPMAPLKREEIYDR